MRSLVVAVLLCVISASSLSWAANLVEIRLVLLPAEMEKEGFDVAKNGVDSVYVHKLPYLADRDIDKVEMFRSANEPGRLLVGFKFNETGKKRLYNFTKRFGQRRVAIFTEGRYVMSSSVISPVFLGGVVVIRWPGTESELRKFAFEMNKKPAGIISLYLEEQGKYNDVAADAWAETYANVNKYIEEKRAQAGGDRSLVEEVGGGE